MGLLDDCLKYFGSSDLYGVFGIGATKDASDAELKKAYKKVSLLCHPDRVSDDKKDEATRKFQTLSKVHCILSDKEKRAVYDETGCIDEENTNLEDKDWTDYWRLLFPKITVRDIDDFMKEYRGSKEELEDLKKSYIQCKGDMDNFSEVFMGYNVDEEEKYQDILRDLIDKKEIPDFPKFSKESNAKKNARVKRFKKEAAEAEVVSKEMEDSLANAIMQRSARRESDFDNMIQDITAKYCKSRNKNKKK